MCTGISLQAADGSVVAARTVEWALGDAHHDRFALFPRGHRYTALTPDGPCGLSWEGRHGFVTVTAYGQPYGPDGLNEAGLYVGVYYFPGYCSLAPYDAAEAQRSASVGDFMQWLLSSFASVAEVRRHLHDVRVVEVQDTRFGGAPLPFHWKIADPQGEAIVVEIVDGGQVRVHDAFLGVITNAPSYDWHLTNLRNHIGLSPAPTQPITLDGVRLAPFGSGSGFLGLPGDFTPPSRFVRAAALTACARPLTDAADAVFEAFRILDSFNIPVGATGPAGRTAGDIVSATQVTTVCDLANRAIYFHTMANRQVRRIDLRRIDFATLRHQVLESPEGRQQAVLDLLPAA